MLELASFDQNSVKLGEQLAKMEGTTHVHVASGPPGHVPNPEQKGVLAPFNTDTPTENQHGSTFGFSPVVFSGKTSVD